jgi:hypothetical protein
MASFSGYFFLGNTLFWDDWQLYYGNDPTFQDSILLEAGSPPFRNIFEDLLQFNPFLFRTATFGAFFLSGILLNLILRNQNFLDSRTTNIITLFFMVVPVNSARVSMIVTWYAICYFAFFLAWYFTIKKSWIIKIVSLSLFLISFSSLAFIPFAVLVACHLAVLEFRNPQQNGKVWVATIALLPFIYYSVFRFIWPLGATYEDYYTPRNLSVVKGLLFLLVCAMPLALMILRNPNRFSHITRRTLFSSGLFALAIGAFPYLAGGHLVDISDWMIGFVPNFSDWDSRHQLLLPLGFALILTSVVHIPNPDTHINTSLTLTSITGLLLLLGACIALNFTFTQEYILDSIKQRNVISALKEEVALLHDTETILVSDSSTIFNARGRVYREYEWLGLLNEAGVRGVDKVVRIESVDCDQIKPGKTMYISTNSGRLQALLRWDIDIIVTVKASLCGTVREE